MSVYLLRLDDASEYMNRMNWERLENLCDTYNVRPLIGVIPDCRDKQLMVYGKVPDYPEIIARWQAKKYMLAMHGFTHVFETAEGGINPVKRRSEFAGLPLERQKEKIKAGIAVLHSMGLFPKVFFAPAHTFDRNTLEALRECSDIRIISDTIANDCYFKDDFYFVPQQSGKVRNVHFRTTTFCYHPNKMKDSDFIELETFLKKNHDRFTSIDALKMQKRKLTIYDHFLRWIYFTERRITKKDLE